MPFSLDDDVGRDCTNHPSDVRALHQRLAELGYPSVPDGDTVDARTVELINLVQSINDGRETIDGDGRVDVPAPRFGSTYDWLRARNAPSWVRLPQNGTHAGIRRAGTDATRGAVHATAYVARTVQRAGAWYHDQYHRHQSAAPPLTVGPAAGAPGEEPAPHGGHATGISFDLLLPRADGSTTHDMPWTSDRYVREPMRAMLRAVRHQPMVTQIYFDDEALAAENLCTPGRGCDRVAHVVVDPLLPEVDYAAPNADRVDRAVSFFGGADVAPDDYPMTAGGFARYLAAQGVEHFDADEFLAPHHPDTAAEQGYSLFLPPHAWWPRGAALGLLADRLRERVGKPVVLRNWWRPRPYNAEVASAEQSDHITAHALDLDFPSPADRETAQSHLEALREEEPWLEMSLGTGGRTIHVGLLSYRKQRSWTY